MTRRRLPIGIQDFRMIRSEGFYYVDKTPLIRQLTDGGRHYFLSRPRRFGKSLLLDTLRSLFACEESLFRGLDIHPHWDWRAPRPTVRLSFGRIYNEPDDIERSVLNQLAIIERNAGLPPASCETGPERLQDLLDRLHRAAGRRVVVLVDEYDKPILDMIEDPERAAANRDYLRGFYGVIKDSAEHVRFVFVTGVSMFSKVSLFSGLNNLEDISLDPRYAAVCGYREEDLDRVFGPEMAGLDRGKIRAWYNGYCWRGDERVYNPFDVLLLLKKREFRPYWFETGSPEFLFKMLLEQSVNPMELENRTADMSLVSSFDVNDISVEALLFQTGYLTIVGEEEDEFDTSYRLDYPNREVRVSLNRGLLAWLSKKERVPAKPGREFCALLEAGDFVGFEDRLRAWISGMPSEWHNKGALARHEAWYASLLYMCLRSAGVDLSVEEASSHGRADMALRLGRQVFVLEFKMAENTAGAEAASAAAIAQIRDRGYAEKYRAEGKQVRLIGVACGRGERNITDVRVEPA